MGIKSYITKNCSFYVPKNPEKYIGKDKRIICRSSWEGRLCIWFDNQPNVLQWCSECVQIKYQDPIEPIRNGKPHFRNYYPDFYVVARNGAGEIERYVVEVKPKKETKPPVRSKNHNTMLLEQKTYAINQAKWRAAEYFCKRNGLKFKILTEDNIPGVGK